VAERDSVADRQPARPPRPPSGRAAPSNAAPSNAAPSKDPRSRPAGDRRPAPPSGSGSRARAARQPKPPEPTIDAQAAFKGILIVLVTVIVGAFVFWQGLHRPAEELEATTPLTIGADVSSTAAPESTPPTTARPPATRAAPAELAVVVGNAIDPDLPVASTVATKLGAAGYTTVRKMNVSRPADRSAVHFAAPEWRDDALAVARALGIPEMDVSALPNPPPLDSAKSKVFVIVGREPKALGATPSSTTTTR
jgi:hypothetical protein